MAKTLQEIINKNLQQPANIGMQDATQGAQSLLGAKTGRALQQRGPAGSSIAEKIAIASGQAASKQQQQQGQLLGQQQKQQGIEQQQSADIAAKQRESQAADFDSRIRQEKQQLLGEIEREGKQLDFDKNAAQINQLSFMMAYEDQKARDALISEGRKQRLDDDIAFNEALQASIFGEQMKLFKDNLAFQEAMNADDRAFQKELSKMDINYALEVAKAASDQANMQAMYSGASGVLSGGIQAVEAYGDIKEAQEENKKKENKSI